MANRVKFKVSIKELTFEFEGDQERAQVLQGRLTDTLGSLAAAQSDVIDVPPSRQLPAAPTPPVQPAKRRRRSRKPLASDNGASAATTSESDSTDENTAAKATRKRRPHGTSYRSQVTNLFNEGFFSSKRSSEEVHAELVRRGYNFELRRINESLLAMTQSQKLSRTMNGAGNWEYENGTSA